MDRFAIPERAIAAFERVHGVLVTLHDFHGRIRPRLAIDRGYHRHPLCHAAKARDNARACLAFDMAALHAAVPLQPDGFLQRCHAGLVEAVAPLRLKGEVVAVLNAGPRREGGLAPVLGRTAISTARPDLPTWTTQQAEDVLECLRQLACRLERWLADTADDRAITLTDRRSRILHFIDHRSRQQVSLGDLARELGLSPDRAGHVVSEEFGMSFLDLLARHRLERAAALLSHSDLPVATVALDCGFGDLSGFHRRFRARFGATPLRFRDGARAKDRTGPMPVGGRQAPTTACRHAALSPCSSTCAAMMPAPWNAPSSCSMPPERGPAASPTC